ncbi:LysR family transcriptional regulator [Curtobacterium sp. MCPF17_002]|uniref:LysR family transcriptional regulator n=1 Tax=Curtobacterium sp. MCPF17_002 TaxID=2175645 RepID=UPI000DA8D57C|nr:LysR family transcriptional regulator [Curtobacterium sp. MCPF17_002]WIB76706.1 LysR family transcriptional regulator [Curtobacterium sp. MCPF17_002]
MQLDLNLLTALDALLEEQSVTGAADRLHLSAPAMSRALGRIRQATGDEILVRAGRVMRPTPRALAMHAEVRSLVLRSREVLTPETTLDVGTLHRTFTIRAHDALVSVLAPQLVERTRLVAPGVALRFLGEANGDDTDLRRGLVDLEIGSAAPAVAEIDHDQVATDPLVGLARRGNPLLGDGDDADADADADEDAVDLATVDLAAWAAAPHVVVSRRGRFGDRIDEVLAAAGRSRSVIASVASTSAAIEVVRATDAVVVVPGSIASRAAAAGDTVAFTPPVELPAVSVVLTWHRRSTSDPAHEWLRGLVRQSLTGQGAP